MFEEPEEPVSEEEIWEEPPSVEEFEEVAPPRGIATFINWTFEILNISDISQNIR